MPQTPTDPRLLARAAERRPDPASEALRERLAVAEEPLTFGELATFAASTGGSALHAALAGPVLVGIGRIEADRSWAFVTRISAPNHGRESRTSVGIEGAAWVLPLAKRSGRFARTLLIGRSPSNDVCIPDASVSKLHARIELGDDGGMLLTDAGSKNGTYLFGRPLLDPAPLGPGDEIRVGHLAFRCLGERGLEAALRAERDRPQP